MKCTSCLAVVLAATSLVARGQTVEKIMSGRQMRVLHAGMDADGDELVTLEEGSSFVRSINLMRVRSQSVRIMENMDTNTDGLLSLDEFEADLRHFKMDADRKVDFVQRFTSFDEDGDSLLSMRLSCTSVQRSFSMMARLTGQHCARLSSMTAPSAKFLKASPTRGLGKK